MASGRSRRERDLELFRRMRKERMMMRRGYDREYYREMEMEMMYEREMMYRLHGEDIDFEFEEPKISEEEIKRRDRQELVYWINRQMLPSAVRIHGNLHDTHGDLLRFIRDGKFKVILEDTHRFQVNYISYRDVPTEDDLILEMCRYAVASFNAREEDNEKIFILLCGVEEDLDTKIYPLATGIPYLDPEKREEMTKTFRKLLRRGGTRRHRLKDSEVSCIDEGMIKFDIINCVQKAACNSTPIPPIAVLSVQPVWVFCEEWCYMFGTVDDNRRWHPRVHGFVNSRAVGLLDVEEIEKVETYLSESYERYRRAKYCY